MKKVLYLYSGTRKNKILKIQSGKSPDTGLYGLNHLSQFDIQANFKELSHSLLSFKARHFLSFFLTFGYDIIFGSSLLYLLIWQKILDTSKKFVLLNISLNRTLAKNKKNKFRFKFIKWLLGGLDKIVCLSNYQLQELSNYGISRNKLIFIPLGVDKDYFEPNFNQRQGYILSVGKDMGRDYNTVIQIAQKMPTQKFKIICKPQNIKHIEKIPKNVEIIYNMEVQALKKEYTQAKLLLLITHADGYIDGADCSGQTVLLDAFASGLPVIATRKRYLADYGQENKELLLSRVYDSQDIINKIKQLDNPELSTKLSKNAYHKIVEEFNSYNFAQKLSNEFKKL